MLEKCDSSSRQKKEWFYCKVSAGFSAGFTAKLWVGFCLTTGVFILKATEKA